MVILAYHRLCQMTAREKAGAKTNFYTLSLERFERQMEYLVRHDVRTCGLDDVVSGRIVSPSVVVTFDDGCDSDFTAALPVLQRLGLRATFFVCLQYVGQPGYMTWKQIKALGQAGMAIESHGLMHRDLTQLREDDIADELRAARLCLQRNLGRPVRYLAIPGGFADERVYRAAFHAGYQAVCNSVPGLANGGRVLKRVALQRAMSDRQFEAIIQGRRMHLLALAVLNSGIKRMKSIISVRRYEAIKARLWG